MVMERHVADNRKIMKRDCLVFFDKLEEMVFLKPFATAAGERDNKNEIGDQEGCLKQLCSNAHIFI